MLKVDVIYMRNAERVKKVRGRYFSSKEERMCVYSPADSTKTLVVLSLQKLSRRLVSCRQCTHVQSIRVIASRRKPVKEKR